VCLIVAGLFSFRNQAVQGALFQSFAHGINVVGLFAVADFIQRRTKSYNLASMGGLRSANPKLASMFLIILFGSVALPLTNGFVGEFMILYGLAEYKMVIALFAGITVIFSAIYMLRAFQDSMLGKSVKAPAADLTMSEWFTLAPIAALVIATGIFPGFLMTITEPAVEKMTQVFYYLLNNSMIFR
jgi:NADH-quinone oxidoreductase subunit M